MTSEGFCFSAPVKIIQEQQTNHPQIAETAHLRFCNHNCKYVVDVNKGFVVT